MFQYVAWNRPYILLFTYQQFHTQPVNSLRNSKIGPHLNFFIVSHRLHKTDPEECLLSEEFKQFSNFCLPPQTNKAFHCRFYRGFVNNTGYRSYLRHWLPVLFTTLVTSPIYDTGYQSYSRHWLPVLFTTLVTGPIYDTGYQSYLQNWLPVLFTALATGTIHDTGYRSYLRH